MKILLCLPALLVTIFTAGCDRGKVETLPAAPVAKTFTLTYLAGENGSIEGSGSQTVDRGGSGSAITAVPAAGYHFTGWSDGSMANPRTDKEVSADLEVTAGFALNQYIVTYAAGKQGSIDGAGTQTVDHGGAGIPVRAVPEAGYHFVDWSDGITTAARTDADVTSDLEVTARFAPNQYTLTYLAGEKGSIEGAGSQTVDYGGAGSAVRAIPEAGYHFTGWSDGSTANPRTDKKVSADLEVTAGFGINRYRLTYTAGEHGSLEGAGMQTVDHGGAGSPVTAVPAPGYHFAGWSDGVTTANRTDAGVSSDISATAEFEINTYTVGGTVTGLVESTGVVLQNNGGDRLALAADGIFTFASAVNEGQAYGVTVLTQPETPNQTCTVTRGSGKISGENVTDVEVNCTVNTYTIGGTVSGLTEGDHLVLRNRSDDLVVRDNGEFTFIKAVNDGSIYEIIIHDQQLRPKRFCEVANGAGMLAGIEVTNVDVACFAEAELLAVSGNGKIDLDWNSQDFSGAVFRLCRAKEDISPSGFDQCADLRSGVLKSEVTPPYTASKLTNYAQYWFQLEVRHVGGRRTFSEVITATPFGGLNDTGIDCCADNNANRSPGGTRSEKTSGCTTASLTHPGQDALHGRDAADRARKLKKIGSGFAGFDFTKICMSGEAAGEGKCPPNPSLGDGRNNWACTRDNLTGLMWELKTETGLRGRDNTYTWYNPETAFNGGEAGEQDGGRCSGSGCDTQAYVDAVNAGNLCGATDWRLPTRKELLSIVNNGLLKPSVDPRFFPNASPFYFWSASPYADQSGLAWQVFFDSGEVSPGKKNEGAHVRLVRMSGQ